MLFDEWWNDFDKEWFKIEVLQDYSGEDNGPSLQAWLEGKKQKSIELMKATMNMEWIESCQAKVGQGAKLLRIRLIGNPLTPYSEWEMEHYKHVNIPLCGEEVLLINKTDANDLSLPTGDVMIFDGKRVIKNTYTPNGYMTEQTFYEDEDVSTFLNLRGELLKRAVPI